MTDTYTDLTYTEENSVSTVTEHASAVDEAIAGLSRTGGNLLLHAVAMGFYRPGCSEEGAYFRDMMAEALGMRAFLLEPAMLKLAKAGLLGFVAADAERPFAPGDQWWVTDLGADTAEAISRIPEPEVESPAVETGLSNEVADYPDAEGYDEEPEGGDISTASEGEPVPVTSEEEEDDSGDHPGGDESDDETEESEHEFVDGVEDSEPLIPREEPPDEGWPIDGPRLLAALRAKAAEAKEPLVCVLATHPGRFEEMANEILAGVFDG